MSFTFICPSKAETACTGFLGGMEKTLRGVAWRVEIFASGMRLFKNGEQLKNWNGVPKAIEKYAQSAKFIITQAQEMEGA